MPGLDLLAEDYGEAGGVFFGDEREDGAVEGAEHFGGELGVERGLVDGVERWRRPYWADIVKVWS